MKDKNIPQDICLPDLEGGLHGFPCMESYSSAAWLHLWSEDPVLKNLSMHCPKFASGESPLPSITLANIPKDG